MKNEHIVRVGPVHAGVIEPGVFRFKCHGEIVEQLDIELGFQHRDIEKLIAQSNSDRHRMMCLAEQIAGDTTIGHATAMAQILENHSVCEALRAERRVALELERMAMSISTAAALLGDVAYRIGMSALQPLRTRTVNTLQMWSGNRFGRTLIRPGGSYYRLTDKLLDTITANVAHVASGVELIGGDVFSSPSVLSRLDDICIMESAEGIFSGDLNTRLAMRFEHVARARQRIQTDLDILRSSTADHYREPDFTTSLPPNTLIESNVEGWRGQIVHTAHTDTTGAIDQYTILDPSKAAWHALAQSMTAQQISDFPVNNKSFNLSYCGVDL